MTRLFLRRGHDRRIRGGHPWIFSNEIERLDAPALPGAAVAVVSADGQSAGTGYYNPHSLIAARILSRQSESIDNAEFFAGRLRQALACRRRFCGDLEALRLVHGEADEVVPVTGSRDAEAVLRGLGVPVESAWRPGLAHGIDDAGIALGGLALQRHLGVSA